MYLSDQQQAHPFLGEILNLRMYQAVMNVVSSVVLSPPWTPNHILSPTFSMHPDSVRLLGGKIKGADTVAVRRLPERHDLATRTPSHGVLNIQVTRDAGVDGLASMLMRYS